MLRAHSTTRVEILDLVRRGRAQTRRELGDVTGLSRSVVAQTVSDLISEGLVQEHAAEVTASRGRPSTHLQVGTRAGYVAALDLGHEHITVALADLHQRVILERHIGFAVDIGAEPALGRARRLLEEQMRATHTAWDRLRGVGIALPFPVTHGVVRPFGHISGWDNARPESGLRLPADISVVVINDADAGAWDELVTTRDPRQQTVLYAKAGDGIGVGLIVNGTVVSGAHGASGEIGHTAVPECTVRCRCHRIGCLDALVTSAARPGASAGELEVAGHAVGRTLAQLASLIDPDVVVLGGELGFREGSFVECARASYADRANVFGSCELNLPQHGLRAELYGVLDLATEAAWATILSW